MLSAGVDSSSHSVGPAVGVPQSVWSYVWSGMIMLSAGVDSSSHSVGPAVGVPQSVWSYVWSGMIMLSAGVDSSSLSDDESFFFNLSSFANSSETMQSMKCMCNLILLDLTK